MHPLIKSYPSFQRIAPDSASVGASHDAMRASAGHAAQVMIRVANLHVSAATPSGGTIEIVKGVDFSVRKGEVLALIGESGSGKTTIALALLGYARPGCTISGGEVRIGDVDVLALNPAQRRSLRSKTVAYVAQSASSGFNPARTIMEQVIEPALLHGLMTRGRASKKAIDLFHALALPEPETIGCRYPHQVSGGQLQRLMAAMALITDPAVVVFDEPTTALDVTTQIEVLVAFKKVIRELQTTAIYVSHDLAVVAQMADQIVVLSGGHSKEHGAIEQVLKAPTNDYTKQLLAAARHVAPMSAVGAVEPPAARPILEVRGLAAGYGRLGRDGMPALRVLDGVNLSIAPGTALGVIGESGSGKTTLARVIAGLADRSHGEVLFNGLPLPTRLANRTAEQYRQIQIVFQNADTALNPMHSIADILKRPLSFYHRLRGAAMQKRMLELLDLVQLPASIAKRSPVGLSGGQKQRVNLARALAAEPALILCDEVTSALDTVVGAAILALLNDLRKELGMSYMFISHDISTVQSICDDVVVLYAGHCVQSGSREVLAGAPYHPYTHLLVNSVPALETGWLDTRTALGSPVLPEMGSSTAIEELCSFRARCTVRLDGRCNVTPPSVKKLPAGGEILCHHSVADLFRLQRGQEAHA